MKITLYMMLEDLEPDIRTSVMTNIKAQGFVRVIQHVKYKSLEEAFINSFALKYTPEGSEFWLKIARDYDKNKKKFQRKN